MKVHNLKTIPYQLFKRVATTGEFHLLVESDVPLSAAEKEFSFAYYYLIVNELESILVPDAAIADKRMVKSWQICTDVVNLKTQARKTGKDLSAEIRTKVDEMCGINKTIYTDEAFNAVKESVFNSEGKTIMQETCTLFEFINYLK